jgi:ribosomal protein S18 acetylase RimI-like enzyme
MAELTMPRADSGQELQLEWRDELGKRLLERLCEIWVDVTNAGGAVGFLPPVTNEDITAIAAKTFARVEGGLDHLLTASVDDAPIGWVVLEQDPRLFASHWRTVKRVQVAPDRQGLGYGREMMTEASRFAREDLHLEFLVLSVRDGTGVANFYEGLGYQEMGRIKSALRVVKGDDRDEIFMVQRL